jgi:tRNA (uracil-5-)-methyltransferase TRM9
MSSLSFNTQALMEEGHFEGEHVQQVYEAIAPHFSATRYKRWPIVDKFIKSLSKGSFGCDFGCGNGKNLENDPNGCITIGLDA